MNKRHMSISAIVPLSLSLCLVLGFSMTVRADSGWESDESITAVVKLDVLLDPRVDGDRVEVTTKDGIVTLVGRVDNILAKWQAVELASRIRGVRSVVDRIIVDAPRINDEQLQKEISESLKGEPAIEGRDVRPAVEEGQVALIGTVHSQTEKTLAARAAADIRGVRELDNQLIVTPIESRPDPEIETDVRRRIRSSAWIESPDLKVSAKDGHVTIAGPVSSLAEHLRVREVAWVAGVKSVNFDELVVDRLVPDKLKVRRASDLSNGEIERSVRAAIAIDPRISRPVSVTVADREVLLGGTVASLASRRAAEQDALNTFGVKAVVNRIAVRPTLIPSDEVVSQGVIRVLSVDPYVSRLDVHVTVHDNHVFLDGVVDSHYDRIRAEDVASRVPGAIALTNRLKVDETRQRSDAELESTIRRRLSWDVHARVDGLAVDVENGVARLEGIVKSPQGRVASQNVALSAGAIRVVNNLVVEE